MTPADMIEFANRLLEAGAQILVTLPDQGGWTEAALAPADVPDFIADPYVWQAKSWGISPEMLDQWLTYCGAPRCGATTKSGRLCKQSLGPALSPDAFASLHREGYCRIHSGI